MGKGCPQCGKIKKYKKQSGFNHHNWVIDRIKLKEDQKIARTIRILLRTTLKKSESKKTLYTEEMMGYTTQQLLEHLKKQKRYKYWIKSKNK